MFRKDILDRLWDACIKIMMERHQSESLQDRMLEEITEKKPAKYERGRNQVNGNVNATKVPNG